MNVRAENAPATSPVPCRGPCTAASHLVVPNGTAVAASGGRSARPQPMISAADVVAFTHMLSNGLVPQYAIPSRRKRLSSLSVFVVACGRTDTDFVGKSG